MQPKHPDANHNMGVLAVGVGKVQEALPFFKTALEANPNTAQFWLSYIDALIKLDRLPDAKAVLDQAKDNGAKGDAFDQLKQRLEGVEPSNIAVSQNQDPPQDQLQSVIDLYTQGQLQETLSETMQLLQQFPNSFSLYNIQGATNVGLGQLDASIVSYNKALAIKPDHAEAYNNMSVTLKDQGKLNEAIEASRKALAIKSDNAAAYINMGNALRDQGKTQEAIDVYNKALAIKPGHAEAYYGLAASLYKQGDLPGVMTNLQHVYSNTSEHNSEHSFKRLPYKILDKLRNIEADTIKSPIIGKKLNKFPLKIERAVEPELIKCLYELGTQSLDDTKDARYGAGKCSPDFKLFESEQPIIKKVSSDLLKLMEDALGAQILYHDSFFKILGAGGGSKPHNHIKLQDKNFDLDKYKYSLVYYLSVGDQNCTEPGVLKLYEPNIDILPTKGQGILIPAIRKHSAVYNGLKDRIMIGCNFYAL